MLRDSSGTELSTEETSSSDSDELHENEDGQPMPTTTTTPPPPAETTTLDNDFGAEQSLLHQYYEPLSAQQFQSMLREMRLCAPTSASAGALNSTSAAGHAPMVQDHATHHNNNNNNNALYLTTRDSYAASHTRHHNKHQQNRLSFASSAAAMHQNKQDKDGNLNNFSNNNNNININTAAQRANHLLQQLLHNNNIARNSLIHLHKSPDYCHADLSGLYGFAGLRERACTLDLMEVKFNSNGDFITSATGGGSLVETAAGSSKRHLIKGPNHCDNLCCGRGYEQRETLERYNCDCEFKYCCKIQCNSCERKKISYVCK